MDGIRFTWFFRPDKKLVQIMNSAALTLKTLGQLLAGCIELGLNLDSQG